MDNNIASRKDGSVLSNPLSSPNISALLKIKVLSWSQETGFPVSVRVSVANRIFSLHKHPLFSKSGYFKKRLNESNEVKLPKNFPGGAETFEMIALFIYGSSTLVDPFNVAALRCAAEFLEMTEEHSSGNLSERFDIYLNQVVLQSWDDTLTVLRSSRNLLPWSEDLLIVSRCIESLAFMACMEILDPERRREKPIATLEALASQPWSCEIVEEIVKQDLWIEDLISLQFAFFKRVIVSLRRQGMKEKYVSPIILFYANNWILSPKIQVSTASDILQGIVDLLPLGERASKVIPVGFYFSLLSQSLDETYRLRNESKQKLQQQIVSLLHFAREQDFLLPKIDPKLPESNVSSCMEVTIMKTIFKEYVSLNKGGTCPITASSNYNHKIAELWDMYLLKIASDSDLNANGLVDLIEIVPLSSRKSHDHLYRALNTFLAAHPDIPQEERGFVCKYLNCQKLSQEMCIDAVQNELMPLRLIVQALFVQQLNTQQAFKEYSDSFRYAHSNEFSGSLPSSWYPNSKSQTLVESPYIDGVGSTKLEFLLRQDTAMQRSGMREEITRIDDYESSSFRIQNLEQELISLKRTLQLQSISKKREPCKLAETEPIVEGLQGLRQCGSVKRSLSKKRNAVGQMPTCIGSVNLTSQKKYASKLLKIFRRISLFGKSKATRKASSGPGVKTKPL